MPALLILVTTIFGLAEGVFIKRYNIRHDKGGFLFTAMIGFFSMLVFLFSDRDGFVIPSGMWIYAIIAGSLYCSASFLTYVALGCGSFAMSMLILSYALVFSIGYGLFFLGETATIFTYVGLALIMVSLYLTKSQKKEKDAEAQKVSLKWVICIGLSVVGSGMYSVVCRMQQIAFNNSCTNEFMVIALGFSTSVLVIIGLIKDGKDLGYVLKYGAFWTALAGCANGINNLCSLFLNTMMPISISSPVKAGVRIVVSFLISMFLFKEKFEKRQIVGVALGAAALVLLNL